ncbi:MAG TPA: alpha-L-arabinofuranosidase C-terminal domain-containing protein [Candidatus Binatia bacterium]|nr:alpha-L-arabinofuranosidase C-terminal domain-containing protein [Candidatus Sulfotelmatobacter sp.]HXJ89618.1 alpha-L-arabinofuranosidase C-terminal domain-containing protein [Candidatus Binatia bacterium]
MRRREFIRNVAAAGAGLLVFRSTPKAFAQTVEGRIEVLIDEPLGTISPNIYGHFTENLSGVVYDGIWVGENSKVPNVGGIRKELVDEMRKISPPVVRFPGGCFADSYDWRDGIGPVDKRPRRTNFWNSGETAGAADAHRYDPNRFGTNEFVQFCRLIGAQPYLAANLRSLPAQEFNRWIEYCNSPAGSTSLADARTAAGFKDPFNVQYWGVGNESWGCGGNFTPQEYAVEYRRFTAWAPSYRPGDLSFVASGPSDDGWNWTRGFLEEIIRKGKDQVRGIFGLALHYYAWNLSRGKTSDWDKGKGDAVNFDAVDWYELLRQGDVMESLIKGHWLVMGEFDPEHHIKLVVDEWGPWYKPGSELTPGDQIEQLPTLRDAVFSGLTLDTFNRHPDKVGIGCCAQLINCLNSLYLAHEDRFCVTPVGHVFAMYAAHQGGTSLRTEFSVPSIHYDRDGQTASFWGLQGSASLHEKQLVLTAINPDVKNPIEAQIVVRGGKVKSGSATVMTSSDIHARNTFDQRAAISPSTAQVEIKGDAPVFRFPAASVVKLTLTLA